MGRYYRGDIEGKLWVGVQSSYDAEFFGVTASEPQCIEFTFDKELDLKKVQEGIGTCTTVLGKFEKKLDEFFEKHNGYNEDMLTKELNVTPGQVRHLLIWYARLKLGRKIEQHLLEHDACTFQADL